MPSQINVGNEDHIVLEELGTPNSTVNMPMERFRFNAGLCSWTERKKTLIIKAGLRKLYGKKLQNNSVRAFGRDLTTKEIKEIKKGEDAEFPTRNEPATRRGAHGRRGAAHSAMPEGSTKTEKAQSRKRKHHSDDEEEQSSDAMTQTKSPKRTRHDNGIAAEVDDLLMFEEQASIAGEADPIRRYPRRSTRKVAATIEAVSGESSADEEYEDTSTEWSSPRLEEASYQSSSDQEDVSERVDAASRESSVDERDDDDGTSAPRYPSRRIPPPGEVGGKSKGPSWKEDQSNEPAHYVGGSAALSQRQTPEVVSASFEHNESDNPLQPHRFDLMMNLPLLEERDSKKDLREHREWVRDFLGDEEAEAYAPASKLVRQCLGYEDEEDYAPASKRLHSEQPVSPLPGSLEHGGTDIVPPQVDQSSGTSKTKEPKLEAESDPAIPPVSYRVIPPRNEKEIQSLIDALLPTREVYLAWTGEPAPRTDPCQSYSEQFDTILRAFQKWWRIHHPNKTLPILAGSIHFGRSVDDWEPPVKDSIYYEAFKKGRRAPHGPNGHILSLPNWQGPTLENHSRKEYEATETDKGVSIWRFSGFLK